MSGRHAAPKGRTLPTQHEISAEFISPSRGRHAAPYSTESENTESPSFRPSGGRHRKEQPKSFNFREAGERSVQFLSTKRARQLGSTAMALLIGGGVLQFAPTPSNGIDAPKSFGPHIASTEASDSIAKAGVMQKVRKLGKISVKATAKPKSTQTAKLETPKPTPTVEAKPASTLPPASIEFLDNFEKLDGGRNIEKALKQNMDRYKHAEQETGVSWKIMAALHWREAQLSPTSSLTNGEGLGTGVNIDGLYISSDANTDAVNAAKHFISNADEVYGVDATKENLSQKELGEAFLAYNRYSLYDNRDLSWKDSPYVMNGLDENHRRMHWVGGGADPGRTTRGGGNDPNPVGALAFMEYVDQLDLNQAS